MVFTTPQIKAILIILNSFNITSAIIFIIVTLLYYNDTEETDPLPLIYLTMLISAICCAAAVMNSSTILQIIANVYLCLTVIKTILGIYGTYLSTYTKLMTLFQGLIAGITYYLAQRIRKTKLHNIISTYTGVAAMPLNPPPHVRSDVI